MAASSAFSRHFGRKVVCLLAAKGIRPVGLQALPLPGFAQYETGYVVNDNGTCRVWTYRQVVEAAR